MKTQRRNWDGKVKSRSKAEKAKENISKQERKIKDREKRNM
jgi:hypothetical protein